MPELIDLPKAREMLLRAVETQGREFVYKVEGAIGGCYYDPIEQLNPEYPGPDGSLFLAEDDPRRATGCLIGTALDLHGVTEHHDYKLRIDDFQLENPEILTHAAGQYFARAQNRQDVGETWGKAYDSAEQLIPYIMETQNVE